MKIQQAHRLLALFSMAVFLLIACMTTDEPNHVLNMTIDRDNDSLLTFDSLIVKVTSKDSSFTQVVFHGKVTDPKQVLDMPLDSRVGNKYTVSLVGYKGGKIGVNKEITILGPNNFTSKDLPIQSVTDTIKTVPLLPEILAPTDTSVSEGDSLHFRVSVNNPFKGPASLTLKDTLQGAWLDTVGRNPGDGYFSWRPDFNQGRADVYAVTFVYAYADKKIEKITRVKVLNVNRPPKLTAITDQKVKESETLTFKIDASDPDGDSLTLTTSGLPTGAAFTAGTFTWTPTVGQAGNYSVKFKVSDGKDSDVTAALITVGNVDVSPPLNVKIISPVRDTTVNFTPVTILYTVNGTALQKKIALTDGRNKIFIDTTVAGRTSMDTITITLDTVPPGRPGVRGASPVHTRTPTWTWSSGGGGSGVYRYTLDNLDMAAAITLADTAFTAAKDLDSGTHTLYVQERDVAGNWSLSGSHSVRIDTTRPTPPTVTVNQTSPTNVTTPTWNWSSTGNEGAGIFRFQVDKADFQNGSAETTATSYRPEAKDALKEGEHILYVQQRDSAGNWSNSASAPIVVDLTPPFAPVFEPLPRSPLNSLQPIWGWKSGGGGTGFYRLRIDDSDWTKGADTTNQSSFKSSILTEGIHTLFVQERDEAGNWSDTSSRSLIISLRTEVGGAGFTPGVAHDLSLAFANDGITPYLAFQDETQENKATVMRFNGSSWEIVGKAGFSPGGAFTTFLAISKAGIPYVAFMDMANGNKITVMWFNGGSWEVVGAPGFSQGNGYVPSLAFNNADVPYVVYRDLANGNKATVMRFNGGFWEKVGDVGFTPGGASFTSMAFNSAGIPYVAFCNDTTGNQPTVMRFNGTSWENMSSAPVSTTSASSTSLIFNASDVPYVSFNDDSSQGKVTVKRFSGSGWENVGNGGISTAAAYSPSLAISNDGVPYVAFADGINGRRATIMRFNGSIWENVGSASGLSSGEAFFTVLAVNKLGVPYTGFLDGANGDRSTVIKSSFDP